MLRVDELRMFGDRVLIDPDEKHATSEGGLHIPDAVLKDNPNYYNMTGIVVRVGDGIMQHTFQCLNCNALSPQDEGPCPGCHQPLGNKNTRLFEAGDERYQFGVTVGERVLFNRFAGKQVEIDTGEARHVMLTHLGPVTKRLLIMRESEILGVVEGDHRILPGYKRAEVGQGQRRVDGMNVTHEIAAKRFMGWAKSAATEPRHPWNSPEWFKGVSSSLPLPFIQQTVGRQARVLVSEAIAAAQFRAKRAFTGAA